jgi:hypothetical protein
MGPCIVSIFQYICNKMQRHTVHLNLETALHVSGGTSTHHRERIQLYLQHLAFVTTLLLSAAIVEELEQVWVCCGWRTPPTAHVEQFPDLNKLCNVASCWIYSYIGIQLGARPILHISRIRVNLHSRCFECTLVAYSCKTVRGGQLICIVQVYPPISTKRSAPHRSITRSRV